MNNKFESDVYDLFKSAGCSDVKCKEVMNLISDDDLNCISGGKCDTRREIVKKILSLGLMATSACPTVLFNNNSNVYASNTLKLNLDNNKTNENEPGNTVTENGEAYIDDNISEKNQEQDSNSNEGVDSEHGTVESIEDLNKKVENNENEPDNTVTENGETYTDDNISEKSPEQDSNSNEGVDSEHGTVESIEDLNKKVENNENEPDNTVTENGETYTDDNISEKSPEQDSNSNEGADLKHTTKIETDDKKPSNIVSKKDIKPNKNNHKYISFNNDSKNQAVKYYNHNNRLNNVKKATIGVGIVGVPALCWWLYNSFTNGRDSSGGKRFGFTGRSVVSHVNDLNNSIRSIYSILQDKEKCDNIVNLYKKSGINYKYNISNAEHSLQDDLETFANHFYRVIFNWNAINENQGNTILFCIDKPVSFRDFIDQVSKYELDGRKSEALSEFYKVINNIKNINNKKMLVINETALDFGISNLKILFDNNDKSHTVGNKKGENSTRTETSAPKNQDQNDNSNKNLEKLSEFFQKYYFDVLEYVAPGIKSDSSKSSSDISTAVKNLNDNFEKFRNNENWKNRYSTIYKTTNKALTIINDCEQSYKNLKALINLDPILTSDKNYDPQQKAIDQPYEFYCHLKAVLKRVSESADYIGKIIDLRKDIEELTNISHKETKTIYCFKETKRLLEQLNESTRKLHDNHNYKQFGKASNLSSHRNFVTEEIATLAKSMNLKM